jgi:hypothetical protein
MADKMKPVDVVAVSGLSPVQSVRYVTGPYPPPSPPPPYFPDPKLIKDKKNQ